MSNSHIKKRNVIPIANSSYPRKGKKEGLKNPLIFCSVYLYIILGKKDFSYYLNFLKTEKSFRNLVFIIRMPNSG